MSSPVSACELSLRQLYQQALSAHQNGHIHEAESLYQQILQLQPQFVEAHYYLGMIHHNRQEYPQAVQFYRHALQLAPQFHQAAYFLAKVFFEQQDFDASLKEAEALLQTQPDHVKCMLLIAEINWQCHQWDRAAHLYQRVIQLKPDYAPAYEHLGMMLHTMGGRVQESISAYKQALALDPAYYSAHGNLLYAMHNDPEVTPEAIYQESLRWGQQFAPVNLRMPAPTNVPDSERALRVGFVSGDFTEHPVTFFIENLLRHLDPARIQAFAYFNHHTEDGYSKRLQPYFSVWRNIHHVDDDLVAGIIRQDQIDILIDLSGHTSKNRLLVFARKPAPVQITWLGYFNTTGMTAMDYILCDECVLPPKNERYFTEKTLRMPGGYLCFTVPDFAVKEGEPPVLKTGAITFGCFNNIAKVTQPVAMCWAEILKKVPGSRLLLKGFAHATPEVQVRMASWFSEAGIEKDRLTIEAFSPRKELLESYHRVDIALDPFPYNGGTTTVEAIWMGLPLVALSGNMFASRVSTSILTAAGLHDLICADRESYIRKAVMLAADIPALVERRSTQRTVVEASPLCDGELFAKNFEHVLRGAWKMWCQEQRA